MPLYFISFCPLPDGCRKKGGRLGRDLLAHDARWRIANHLVSSPYHSMATAEADEVAASANLETEEWEEDAPQGDDGAEEPNIGKGSKDGLKDLRGGPYKGGSNKGKSWGKGKSWQGSSWSHDAGYNQGHNQQPQQQPQQQLSTIQPNVNKNKAGQCIARCEAAMRNAARLARAAAVAFEEEAALLQSELRKLVDIKQ
jgi:hypothetical protein